MDAAVTTGMSALPVSVVVPVRDARAALPGCLAALRAQTWPREACEFVFVDNGSRDGSREWLAAQPDVTLVTAERRGASAARNAGVRQARGRWIAFTDADCLPRPDWLAALMAHARGETLAHLVGGRIVAHRPSTDVARFSERLFDQERAILEFRPPYAISANLLVRRDWLLDIGGFDETFLRGQDVELSFRAHFRHGARFEYAREAVVEHVNPATARELWRKALQHGQASAGIHASFGPELGTTVRCRALAGRRYRAIARLATGAALDLLRPPAAPEGIRRERYYEFLVEAGKQLGLVRTWLAGTVTRRGSP